MSVSCHEENLKNTFLEVDKDLLLRDLFPHLKRRISNMNKKNYQFREESSDTENPNPFLDEKMPLRFLSSKKLEIVRKKYQDEPKNLEKTRIFETKWVLESEFKEEAHSEHSLSTREDFEVTRIGQNGKSNLRVIGIDKEFIYNSLKTQENTGKALPVPKVILIPVLSFFWLWSRFQTNSFGFFFLQQKAKIPKEENF